MTAVVEPVETVVPAGADPAAPAAPLTLQDGAAIEKLATEAMAGEPEAAPAGAEPDAPPEPSPKFTAQLPVPIRVPGEAPKALDIDLPSQEAADALRHVVKQAGRVERLTERVAQAQGDAATLDFLDAKPYEGMLWMAQQNPEAGQQFLQASLRANPQLLVQVAQELGFDISMDEYKQEVLQSKAEVAKMKAAEALREGRGTFTANLGQQQFLDSAREIAEDIGDTLGLQKGTEDHEVYTERAAKRMAALWKEKGTAATRADLQQALQPLVQAMTKPAPHHATTQPRHPAGAPKAGAFADPNTVARASAEDLRKLKGPSGNGAPPAGLPTPTKGMTLADFSRAVTGPR